MQSEPRAAGLMRRHVCCSAAGRLFYTVRLGKKDGSCFAIDKGVGEGEAGLVGVGAVFYWFGPTTVN